MNYKVGGGAETYKKDSQNVGVLGGQSKRMQTRKSRFGECAEAVSKDVKLTFRISDPISMAILAQIVQHQIETLVRESIQILGDGVQRYLWIGQSPALTSVVLAPDQTVRR